MCVRAYRRDDLILVNVQAAKIRLARFTRKMKNMGVKRVLMGHPSPSHIYDQWVSSWMSQTTKATRYNDASPEARTTQLRNAKVEENQISELAKSRFENLSAEVQAKLNNTA